MAATDGVAEGVAQRRVRGPQLTYLVKQLELAIRKEMDRVMRPIGVTTPQFTALSVLARHAGISSAELGRRSFVSPQASSEMVAALERKGLVRRDPDASDQRTLGLSLTPAGQQVLDSCSAEAARIEARMVRGLPAADRRAFRHLIVGCLEGLGSNSQDLPRGA